jgi:hypothetical protein
MAVTSPEPGNWYVVFPHYTQPECTLIGGPFDTEAAAQRWHARASSVFLGGFVWQCPGPPSSPDPPPTDTRDGGATPHSAPRTLPNRPGVSPVPPGRFCCAHVLTSRGRIPLAGGYCH